MTENGFFSRAIIYAIILYVISTLMDSVSIDGIGSALFGGIILAILNTLIKPVLQILSLPITIATLGVFSLVVNGVVLSIAAFLTPKFTIDGLWSAILASILFSILNLFITRSGRRDY